MSRRRVRNHKGKGAFLRVGCALYLGFCLFATVWLKAAVVNLEYELGELGWQRADLISDTKMLSAERANFYSSEKIEKVALKRLDMRMPERDNVYFVRRTAEAGPHRASMK